ncbi:MAG: phosphoglycerate dehydrogenase [Deltaproteobacteria bacterium]|jgi:D-3-phosphoglycerate dehydrogenase / 2-oxoglutarate reductase|nr:phosphoglycerate dehydrogenase [Deltaproteobacteria bacterium]MBT4089567.1 phosphoglycerate dehydrogenase [Deltaproteobacteria bacterium]MBT4263933.1 phosphoglycerate dehydrogenase [Deltaproteobacteria bacterium]MBT4639876.1 phosphoglycerate dehydrogenase [Deltaproteobacteria bacterium]MBT6503439.1 phosphoglycerate dehydrogenase [Deltaproteobacteria bacterium]
MLKVLKLNQISAKGLKRFSSEKYEIASEFASPDAILVRSTPVRPENLPATVRAIARAGAGVDKICVDECTMKGIPVFNTPGANANSVKELITLSLLLSSRGVVRGIRFLDELAKTTDDPDVVTKTVEKEKKRFAGSEIIGRTLGIVGLGAIGSIVAEMAMGMGMEVLGYDPSLSVDQAWRLSNKVKRIKDLSALMARSDFITLHLPMLESTKYMINRDSLQSVKKGARLLNFSREKIVDPHAIVEALDNGKLSKFITDFPHPVLMGREDIILMPHIGASTKEAEENCATMAADQLIDFLENGNIKNSVNFPNLNMERTGVTRLAFSNENVPNMLGQVLPILATYEINVLDMLNRSRGSVAYTLLDVDTEVSEEIIEKIKTIDGIYGVRIH